MLESTYPFFSFEICRQTSEKSVCIICLFSSHCLLSLFECNVYSCLLIRYKLIRASITVYPQKLSLIFFMFGVLAFVLQSKGWGRGIGGAESQESEHGVSNRQVGFDTAHHLSTVLLSGGHVRKTAVIYISHAFSNSRASSASVKCLPPQA